LNKLAALSCLLLLTLEPLHATSPAALEPVPAPAVNAIHENELRMNLEFLASPEFGGRYTLSPSFQVAARYLATRLKAYGYQPAAKDGSYMQKFEVKTSEVKPDQSALIVNAGGTPTTYTYGDFFNAGLNGGEFSGGLVFVGYGISAPRLNHDDYADLDVKGKFVVVVPGNPKEIDSSLLRDDEWEEGAAQKRGAIGVIYLPRAYELEWMKTPPYREQSLRKSGLAAGIIKVPVIRVNPTVAEKLLATIDIKYTDVFTAQKSSAAIAPKGLPLTLHLKLTMSQKLDTTQNVVGWLPGTDAKMRSEYVMFSAHYDHLRTNGKGDIYPGADDDGSGTVAVLNIAKALAQNPPKRSVLIMFHAGEEMGLLGSEFNADIDPVKPLPDMVADFNIDMIGRSKAPGDTNEKNKQLTPADTIYIIGEGRTSDQLRDLNIRTNAAADNLKFDYLLNDPAHPDRIFYRSDHWNYGKHGIPFIFYFDGISEDYHKPTDTVDKIDFDKMAKVTRLVLETGYRVANLKQRIQAK
jgi:hypothetical protein